MIPFTSVWKSAMGAVVAAGLGAASPAAAQRNPDAVVPFTIRVPDSVLRDLKQRLSRARFADELPDVGWDYGTNLDYLRSLTTYWRERFDWRAQEKRLNQFEQFTTIIDGVDVHFVHQRSKNPNARALLLLNGWPSSLEEYTKVIGPLTDPVTHGGRLEDSFHVVIPSMPGFGFSGKPPGRGYDPERIARMWVTLMARLGYARYGVHGSDWGSGIATRVALDDAVHVSGLHLAGCGSAPGPAVPPTGPNANVNAAHNLGYQEIQSTKPQTLGQGLSDSPVGLASWIAEKWYDWSDHDGDLDRVVTRDELLTTIMIYWVTNSGASSARIYYESRHMLGGLAPNPFPRPDGKVTVPTGCGAFPSQYDRRHNPFDTTSAMVRADAAARYNLVHFTTMPKGGHFPALEQPALWLDDLRTFFRLTGAAAR
ncbi:MAG TPA: epoxide hydrolase [Vicinamibacterales bacterium]|nr:epoxide hydrolase [Vicinamibacterales bacterium]